MVNFNGKNTDDNNIYHVIPEGTYKLLVDKIELSTTTKGDEMWKVKMLVAVGEHKEALVYDNIIWSENQHAKVRAKQFLKCFRVYLDDKVSYSPFELEGKSAMVDVVIGQTNRGNDRNEIPFDGYYTYKDDEKKEKSNFFDELNPPPPGDDDISF